MSLLTKFSQTANNNQKCGICNSCNTGCNSCNTGCFAMNAEGFDLSKYCRQQYYACNYSFAKCYNTGSCTADYATNAGCSKYQGCGTCEICQSNYSGWGCTEMNMQKSKCWYCVDCHALWGTSGTETCDKCNDSCQTANGCQNCNECNDVCIDTNACTKCVSCEAIDGTCMLEDNDNCGVRDGTQIGYCALGNSVGTNKFYCELNYNISNAIYGTFQGVWINYRCWWCVDSQGCTNQYYLSDVCWGDNSWCNVCQTKDATDECVYCEVRNGSMDNLTCNSCNSAQGCIACEGTCQGECNSCQLCNRCLSNNYGASRQIVSCEACNICVRFVGPACSSCDAFRGTCTTFNRPMQTSAGNFCDICERCYGCVSCQQCNSCQYCNGGTCQVCDTCVGNNVS